MNFLHANFNTSPVLDIVLGILAVVLIFVIDEKKQSRKGYFITFGLIVALVFYFIAKYLPFNPNSGAVADTTQDTKGGDFHMPWAQLIWSLVIVAIFGALTFLASRPWNVAPPKLSYPTDDKASKAIRDETADEKAQRKLEEKYYHWPSIIGYAGMGLSLLVLVLVPLVWLKLISVIVLFPFFFWLVGNLAVPLRRRWMLKFMGDLIQDRDSRWLSFSTIRTKCIREFHLEDGRPDNVRIARHINRMENNGFFMDAGWNRIPLLAIILPFTQVEAMQYEEVEVRFQTEQLPTKGRSEDPDKRDQNKDGREDPYSAAATVSLDQRIKCVIGEFPFTFVYKTGADRSEAVQVTSRYVASFNAQELATMEIDEAMFYPFFESQETPRGNIQVPNASRSKLPNANNVRQAHRLVLEELDRGSIEYNGVGITDYKVLDKNPDDAVQKAMNDLTMSKLQEEIRYRLGVAAGNEAAAEIQQIVDAFNCSEQAAMFYLINRDRAKKSATHWVDGLGNLGNMASAFGEAASGAAPRSSGSRPRSGGSRRGPDSTT